MLNAFTVDVEDYFQVSAFEPYIDRSDWDDYECRVVANTRRILDLLRSHKVNATFFVLGWVAEKHPGLIQEIDADGHEIGSHSYWHRLIYNMTESEFRDDLRQSRDALAHIIGRPVTAFRAPSFSITPQSAWALRILAEEGFQTDSSIFPVLHDRYGFSGINPQIHTIDTEAGPLVEFPMCFRKLLGYRLPVSGGGYFRLYPLSFSQSCIRAMNEKTNRPFVFYIHPWEVDPQQPRLGLGSRLTRFRHYVNLRKTEKKLDALLSRFHFGRMADVLEQHA